MPMLNPGFIAMDPMVADTFTILRRPESVDAKGRAVIGAIQLGRKYGTVIVSDPAKLEKRDDGSLAPRTITVITRIQLIPISAGYQPDVLTWRGTDYTVIECAPHPQFGQGFYSVKAESMNATDKAL